jgi:carbonic anhydrase
MSRILRDLETNGKVAVVGAVYDIATGKVSLA